MSAGGNPPEPKLLRRPARNGLGNALAHSCTRARRATRVATDSWVVMRSSGIALPPPPTPPKKKPCRACPWSTAMGVAGQAASPQGGVTATLASVALPSMNHVV